MITAQELRIGNIVLRTIWLQKTYSKPENLEYDQVTVSHNDIMACFIKPQNFKPIPLTPEILEKCGFKKYEWMEGYFIKTKFGDLMIQFCKQRVLLFFTNVSSDSIGMKFMGRKYVGNLNYTENIKYLHQLQNLYFALTVEELIYKP